MIMIRSTAEGNTELMVRKGGWLGGLTSPQEPFKQQSLIWEDPELQGLKSKGPPGEECAWPGTAISSVFPSAVPVSQASPWDARS